LNAQTDYVYGTQVCIHGHMMTRFTQFVLLVVKILHVSKQSCQNLRALMDYRKSETKILAWLDENRRSTCATTHFINKHNSKEYKVQTSLIKENF